MVVFLAKKTNPIPYLARDRNGEMVPVRVSVLLNCVPYRVHVKGHINMGTYWEQRA